MRYIIKKRKRLRNSMHKVFIPLSKKKSYKTKMKKKRAFLSIILIQQLTLELIEKVIEENLTSFNGVLMINGSKLQLFSKYDGN